MSLRFVAMTTNVYKQSKMFNKSANRSNLVKNASISSSKTNYFPKNNPPKRVLSSKALPAFCEGKSCSAGVLGNNCTISSSPARPKKATKSEFVIKKSNTDLDFCKKCGDALSKTRCSSKSTSSSGKMSECSRNKPIVVNERTKLLDQYYKNENFRRSSESMQGYDNGFKRISLDTIKELPEKRSSEFSKVKSEHPEVFNENPDEKVEFFETADLENVKKLKEFRIKNYFECHSAKSRIENKVSATNLKDHKCTYRFYLNHRLFPVPVSTDHQDNIRCVECHLPLKLRNSDDGMQANGFIQAKIRIGDQKAQDTVMYLPVKDQLIIRERKRDEKRDNDIVYFGVIKLDKYGNSLFNQNLPSNSLALKYQKGYKEYQHYEVYRLQSADNSDVIVI